MGIVETISKHVNLKKSGKNIMGLCPFHEEKTPSFTVSEERQLFKCYGCEAHGDEKEFLRMTGIEDEKPEAKIMDKNHPKWEKFITALSNMERCTHDHHYAKLAMTEIGNIDIEKSIKFFESQGGYCDCEIMFNVA